MKRLLQMALLLLSGLSLLHASLFTDIFLRYVKPGMRPLLIASGVLLLLLAAAEAWSLRRTGKAHEPGEEHQHDDGGDHCHDHSGVPRVAWLLFLPALSLLFFAPPSLGAYTAARQAPPKTIAQQDEFDPLPSLSPLPMTLSDFTRRIQQDRRQAIKERKVQMTGFVTPAERGEGWYLTRLMINCCAADVQSVKVRIHKAKDLPADTWVTVVGTWHEGGTLGTSSAPVALDARTVRKADKPANAYMDALPLPLPAADAAPVRKEG
ncbi:TIGR03943 family putative permease subunit [Streptomyces torulosus]|uniref:TIGR03943 family putative permease subunit n=1 Tax=Streptomyces torulosus TaxID=68276 RepID=UPI0006EBD8C3|nr:TIGR03943 family protein [Streptomyces torulosus]